MDRTLFLPIHQLIVKVSLPPGTYPLQRCILNLFAYNLSSYSIEQHSEPKSNEEQAIWSRGLDNRYYLVNEYNPSIPLIISTDDAEFNPLHPIPRELSAKDIKSLPFNLSGTEHNGVTRKKLIFSEKRF